MGCVTYIAPNDAMLLNYVLEGCGTSPLWPNLRSSSSIFWSYWQKPWKPSVTLGVVRAVIWTRRLLLP